MIKKILIVLVFIILFFSLRKCFYHPSEERFSRAEKGKGNIVVGLIWDDYSEHSDFDEGADVAVEELNGKGGVLGRKIRMVKYDEESLFTGGQVARRFARNPDMVAVIGHMYDDNATAASVVFERNQMVFLAPFATIPDLTGCGLKYVFRNNPTDTDYAREIAKVMKSRGHERVLIIDDNTLYGRALSKLLYSEANRQGLKIANHRSYSYRSIDQDFRPFIAALKELQFDTIFLAANMPLAAKLIKTAFQMGLRTPVFGGDALESSELWGIAGPAAEGTVIPTTYNPHLPDPVIDFFKSRFFEKNKRYPGVDAAQGYDSMHLLAFSFEKSQSIVPLSVSSTMHFLENWHNVRGTYSLTQTGDEKGMPIYFKILRQGKFEFLEESKGFKD
jgi:branched-chain amino acid transport system substrate-binding protein